MTIFISFFIHWYQQIYIRDFNVFFLFFFYNFISDCEYQLIVTLTQLHILAPDEACDGRNVALKLDVRRQATLTPMCPMT